MRIDVSQTGVWGVVAWVSLALSVLCFILGGAQDWASHQTIYYMLGISWGMLFLGGHILDVLGKILRCQVLLVNNKEQGVSPTPTTVPTVAKQSNMPAQESVQAVVKQSNVLTKESANAKGKTKAQYDDDDEDDGSGIIAVVVSVILTFLGICAAMVR
ncbi:MAG: hypothetical protein PUC11_04050 [Elusimicrobia bacterium]|nr:hypothetical protein [Elusimicrobiota bacterium]